MAKDNRLDYEIKIDLWRMLCWRLFQRSDEFKTLIHSENNKPVYSYLSYGEIGFEKIAQYLKKSYAINPIEGVQNILSKNKKTIEVSGKALWNHFSHKPESAIQRDKLVVYFSIIFNRGYLFGGQSTETILEEVKASIQAETDIIEFLKNENPKSRFLLDNQLFPSVESSTSVEATVLNEYQTILASYQGLYKSVKQSQNGEVWVYYWKLYMDGGKGKILRPSHGGYTYRGTYKLLSQLKVLSLLVSTEEEEDYKSSHHFLAKIDTSSVFFDAVCTGISATEPVIERELIVRISKNPADYDALPAEKKFYKRKYIEFFENIKKEFKLQHNDKSFVEALKELIKPKKEIALRFCYAKYIHLEKEEVYTRKFQKKGMEDTKFYAPKVKTEYIYTKLIKYAKLKNNAVLSKDEGYYEDEAFVDMQVLYPTEGLEFDGEHSPRKDISSMKVSGLSKVKDKDIVLTNASYINDDSIERILTTSREVRTGIKFWNETEKGILIVDFTSLKNINKLDITISKIVYSRKGHVDFYEWPNPEACNNSLYVIEEPQPNSISVNTKKLENGDIKGFFRIEINTDIREIDHVKVYFLCEEKE